MSDRTLEIQSIGEGRRGLLTLLRTLAKQYAALRARPDALPIDDLTARELADLGLSRGDLSMTDPRPPFFYGPNGR